ncbi:MAG: pyruvate:ferredoxin (flavodoxin) oxidoreductase [Acidobacteria bacterium]|nr:pyruvate:ferredoxin (flavodoxin) oxidoreductase [Acidobacteriota bacterium]
MKKKYQTLDGNEAAATVAYQTNDLCTIYPITPSSGMGEMCDAWAARGLPNLWGHVPYVSELQSEGGASGSLHGALQAGSIATTFTASQGLLLMIPNMFKLAGELTPTVLHVSARSIAAQALSIFGDHSDVMATRSTGFAMLCAHNVQEVMDFALISQAATLTCRLPFIHFFDGFRTSHEINKVEPLDREIMRALIDDALVQAHRKRALSPDHPVLRGTAQNPDVYFQARETVNPFYQACPDRVQAIMNAFKSQTGRQYHLFDYYGHPKAEQVIVVMGSASGTVEETIDYLNAQGQKIGLVKVRLYRPFSAEHLIGALPQSTQSIAVLDRTKEPGGSGEPLYLDVVHAVAQHFGSGRLPFPFPKIVGGRYGLSSKEFTPAMVKAVWENLNQDQPKNGFTVGIEDDVCHTSLAYDPKWDIEPAETFRALFYGLGSDGTVGANKNSIKIIGENTSHFAQGYFVYDSKKSGSTTISHLRFGPKPIKSAYLIHNAHFIACHAVEFLTRIDMLEKALPGATFLLNSPLAVEEVWANLPKQVQTHLIEKKMKFYVIDAYKVARACGLGGRINTIMQTCFFAISGVMPQDKALDLIKKAIRKTYGAKGENLVAMNYQAVDTTLQNLNPIAVPKVADSKIQMHAGVAPEAPEFVQKVTALMMAGKGDDIPVSALPADGTYPTGTAQWERRNIALEIPVWDPEVCIQCNKCVLVCPHATIRAKVYAPQADAPATWRSTGFKARAKDQNLDFAIQVAPEDCTGCGLCVEICPAKNKRETRLKAINMTPQNPIREQEAENWAYFKQLPEVDRATLNHQSVKESQFLQPLFEFSGACSGCGETPYVKLVSQLFGDRALIANATGCSSIYGGNLPTTPWSQNTEGRGPAWSNSLFEDNAEFGFGFRIAIDQHKAMAENLLRLHADRLGDDLVSALLQANQNDEPGIYEQRMRVELLKKKLLADPQITQTESGSAHLFALADYLVKKSVWIIGGDGWAYDIGFGGLDHVLASGKNINVLVLDTEVYSNTGGQMSKSTPLGAVAKFAAGGKATPKKDLGLIAMSYGHIYVAKVAMGANDTHTIKAFMEAEAYDGPSLILAYSHCIAHGINMRLGLKQQKAAVESAHWQLYRYHPDRAATGENPFQLDSKPPRIPLKEYAYQETRYKMLAQSQPQLAEELMQRAQQTVNQRWSQFEKLAAQPGPGAKEV